MPGTSTLNERAANAKRRAKYPGIRTAVDGSEAVVWVEKHLSQAAAIHATPPANRMADRFSREVSRGYRNLWDEPVSTLPAESAYAAVSMCEGFALAGGRIATFTGGQGLVQSAEILLTAAGKRLPMVFHVASTSLASHAITIQSGHDDINAVSDCGWGILVGRNAQEAADLAVIARRAAELAETPFLNVQDGFITTHSLETILLPEPEFMKVFVGAPDRRVRNVFNPTQPVLTSPFENQDSYMRGRIAQRFFYERVRPSLETAMTDFAELTGRRYSHLRCHRMEDAEYALLGLGSMMDTADAAVEQLRSKGVRIGSVAITTLRPFPAEELVSAVVRCRGITVIEKTDTPLAGSNPLTRQVKSALASAQMGEDPRLLRVPEVYSGAAGVGGRPLNPPALTAAAENMIRHGRRFFVLGIKHPDAIASGPDFDARPAGSYTVRIHSRAGFGSTVAAKLIGSIASELFGTDVKVESSYRGEERVTPTTSQITLAQKRTPVNADPPLVDVVVVHDQDSFRSGDPLAGLRPGGTLFLESSLPANEVWASLPAVAQKALRERSIDLFTFHGEPTGRNLETTRWSEWSRGLALVGAFLKITPWRNPNKISDAELFTAVERILTGYFEHRGAPVIAEDTAIIRRAYDEVAVVVPPDPGADLAGSVGPRIRRNGYKPTGSCDLVPAGFCEHVVDNYVSGRESILESDLYVARSILPAGSAYYRSFRDLATRIPRFQAKDCTGCMDCVNLCPDSAIYARVVEPETIEHAPPEIHAQFSFTAKYYENLLKKGESGGLFGLYIDPDRCKGCGECVEVCNSHKALEMTNKSDVDLELYDRAREFIESLPDTPARFIHQKALGDMLLSSRARLHTGGATSCMGCGESSAIRMLLAATGFVHGADQIGVVAASGCHTAASTTYPFSPYKISWTNTLAANAPADALGIRLKWDRDGMKGRRLWVLGAEDALLDSGYQAFNSLLNSGLDIKVLILDKSTRSPVGDLGVPLLLHRNVFVAQTTAAHINHFYKAVMLANEFNGPAVVVCYSACTTDHGIGDNQAAAQARLAVDSRTFPLFLYDPRAGDRVRERLDLRGNASLRDDWYKDPKTFEPVDFYTYARTEDRFRQHFNATGDPDESAKAMRQNILMNWRHLQELGGLR